MKNILICMIHDSDTCLPIKRFIAEVCESLLLEIKNRQHQSGPIAATKVSKYIAITFAVDSIFKQIHPKIPRAHKRVVWFTFTGWKGFG